MKPIALLLALAAVPAARADFVSDPVSAAYNAKSTAVACTNPDSAQCATATGINALVNAAKDLRLYLANANARVAALRAPAPVPAEYLGPADDFLRGTGAPAVPTSDWSDGRTCAGNTYRCAGPWNQLRHALVDLKPYVTNIRTRTAACVSGTCGSAGSVGTETDFVQAMTALPVQTVTAATSCAGMGLAVASCIDAATYNAYALALNDLRTNVITLRSALTALETPLDTQLLAFPGCEGSGCKTRGGFDRSTGIPTIVRVTNLNDSGSGSLRACVEASGPRVCVFAVSGTITTSGMDIAHPYITVDGRTAPGGGIQVRSAGSSWSSSNPYLLNVRTHDVVVRGLRFRNTWTDGNAQAAGVEGVSSGDSTHHIVWDHDSFQHGTDGSIDMSYWAGAAPNNITMSYSIVAEGVRKDSGHQSRGMLLGTGGVEGATNAVDVDLHHNYFASNESRNPLVQNRRTRLVNNVLFNYRSWGMDIVCGVTVDVVNNLGKKGPGDGRTGFIGLYVNDHGDSDCYTSSRLSAYLAGNKFAGGSVQGWGTGIITSDSTATDQGTYGRSSPMAAPTTGPAITAEAADVLTTSVLGTFGAGASYRLDCGGRKVANRDATDSRVIGQWSSLTSMDWSKADSVAGWGGIPTISPAVSSSTVCSASSRDNTNCTCADSDGDGIPDYWETAFCGSATGCAASGTSISAPWTNLEAFLSGLKEAP